MPDTIVPKGTPTNSTNSIYRAGRRAFMPDTIVPKGTPTNSMNSSN